MTKSDYETLAAFRFALRQFLRFSEEAARAAGLTPQQHQALLAIKGYPGRDSVTVGELAQQLQVAHHSAVGLIDRLVQEQYVRRQQDVGDGRRIWVTLAARGEELLEGLSSAHREQLNRISPHMTALLTQLSGSPAKDAGGEGTGGPTRI